MNIFISVLVIFVVLNIIIWRVVSHQHYSINIKPGYTYSLEGKTYSVPNLPLTGTAKRLTSDFIIKQHQILNQVSKCLNEMNIEAWVSGGTLLGLCRHQTTIIWDDDCDMHCNVKHRRYMFSKQFKEDLVHYDLEPIFMKFCSSLTYATKEGAAVRIRKRGTILPVVDVFFTCVKDGYVYKIDSWFNQKFNLSNKEIFPIQDVLPVQRQTIGGIEINMPNRPLNLLRIQYGEDVMEKMYARSPWISHNYPFSALRFIWSTM